MTIIYVTPAEGLLVPDPVLRDHLPREGRLVERSAHWIRVERDGDVTVSDPPPPEESAEPGPEAAFTPPGEGDAEGQG